MFKHIDTLDLFVLLGYFVLVALTCLYALRKRKAGSEDYFLAGRDIGWIAAAASLFASNIGSEHLVGLAGSGAGSGLAVGHFEWLASFCLLLLGWVFVPFYIKSGVVSMPEFLERRYNAHCRTYFTWISVVGYVLTKISVSLYAGGLIIQEVTGISMWLSASVIVIFTGIYTVAGGLRAVLYTDLMQSIILILGSSLLVILGLYEVGGYEGLVSKLPANYFEMWKPASDTAFPWTGIVFGAPLLGIWYWCTDQYIVQRVLATRGIKDARSATIFAGFLKILPVFLFVFPGLIALALYSDIIGPQPDRALPVLLVNLLPTGLKGLMLAAILAALMSSLSSVFNSCSTIISWDIVKRYFPETSDKNLVNAGRISTGALVVAGLAWIPLMKYISGQIYIYLQSVQAYIAPPIAACFLLGLFIKKLNGKGAITSLLTGFVLGFLRLGLELAYQSNSFDLSQSGFWYDFATINFLNFSALLFLFCSAILVGVSFCTKEVLGKDVQVFNMNPFKVSYEGRGTQISLSLALIGIIFSLWCFYS